LQVSYILPIKNECNYISGTLNAILNQNSPIDYEIIISDGGSTDGTLQIINNFISNNPNIRLIHNPKQIVSAGFNLALNEAIGNIIIRVDGHCEIPNNYLDKCIQLLKSKDVDIVGGCIKTISTGLIGKSIALAQSSWFGVGSVKFRKIGVDVAGYVDSLAFGAHSRKIFAEIGGYDEEMVCNQDDEFNFRAIQAGKKIWIDPTIKTKYYSRSSYSRLFKQYFNYGYFKIRSIQKRKQIISMRHLVPSLFFVSLLSTICYGLYINNPIISTIVFFPYLVCNIFSSIFVSPSVQIIPSIFISYWVLHIGYGLGLIWGFIKFVGRWRDTTLKDYHFNREKFIVNSQS